MAGQPGFFDGEERLRALSASDDLLDQLVQVVDFEAFREGSGKGAVAFGPGQGWTASL